MAVSAPDRTLAQAMAQLPEPPADSRPPYWDFWRHDLWTRAQADPPESFLTWPCVRHTMLVEHFDIGPQVDYLQLDWSRWESVCLLPDVGEPQDRYAGTFLSRNLLNQAYHLKLWEDTTGRRVEDLASIYEFGGGYGALALLVHRLGFRGRYQICDLPEFALLQKWWLSTMLATDDALAVEHVDGPAEAELFIALYSLSETDADFRRRFMQHEWAGSYLLLYSGQWAEHDNQAWAREFVEFHGDLTWRLQQFPARPDWYAIGWQGESNG